MARAPVLEEGVVNQKGPTVDCNSPQYAKLWHSQQYDMKLISHTVKLDYSGHPSTGCIREAAHHDHESGPP